MNLVNQAELSQIKIPKKDRNKLEQHRVITVEDLTKISRKELEEI